MILFIGMGISCSILKLDFIFHLCVYFVISCLLLLNSYFVSFQSVLEFLKSDIFRAWVFFHWIWHGRGNRPFSHKARWEDPLSKYLRMESRYGKYPICYFGTCVGLIYLPNFLFLLLFSFNISIGEHRLFSIKL